METDRKYTLITGASMGLGREFAFECAKKGMNLILVSLPGEKLRILGEYLSLRYNIDVVTKELDLTRKEAPTRLFAQIRERYAVNMVINNAGFGGSRIFESSPLQYLDDMIQLNIRAVSLLTRLFIPELKKHSKAWIMNVSSLAAFSPMPFKTIYPASKAFVYYFSRGLAAELKGTSITVSVLNPGPIMTNEEVCERIRRYGFTGRLCLVSAQQIAAQSVHQMMKGKHVIIPGIFNKFNYLLMRWLPVSVSLAYFSKSVKREFTPKEDKLQVPQIYPTLPLLRRIRQSAI